MGMLDSLAIGVERLEPELRIGRETLLRAVAVTATLLVISALPGPVTPGMREADAGVPTRHQVSAAGHPEPAASPVRAVASAHGGGGAGW